MDALDRLLDPATELLNVVDERLVSGGVPEGHPIQTLLRRSHALPGDAVAWVARLRPEPLAAAGETVRNLLRDYLEAHTILTADGGETGWQGPAAQTYDIQRTALAAQLADDPQSAVGRLTATADYADALAGWVTDGRLALARTLAEILGSAEAVTVLTTAVGQPTGPVRAAATIGARVLDTVVDLHTTGESLARRWRPALAEVALRSPAGPGPSGGPSAGPTLRVTI